MHELQQLDLVANAVETFLTAWTRSSSPSNQDIHDATATFITIVENTRMRMVKLESEVERQRDVIKHLTALGKLQAETHQELTNAVRSLAKQVVEAQS